VRIPGQVPDDVMDEALDIKARVEEPLMDGGLDRRVEIAESTSEMVQMRVYDHPENNYLCTVTVTREPEV
jgi:hypothetical protein